MIFLLLITSFVCGGFAIASQSYLAREFLVVFLGNEMSVAALFFGWFAGVAAGARLARARFWLRVSAPAFLGVSLLAWVVAFPPALLAVRMSRAVMGVGPGTVAPLWKLLVVSTAFTAPFSAFVGVTFVGVCRVWQDWGRARRPVGLVYAAEAAGGVAGGVLFTFFLAGRVTPFTFAFCAYAPLGGCAIVFAVVSRRSNILPAASAARLAAGAALVGAVGTLLALTGSGARLDANSHVARMSTVAPGVVMAARDSRYQNLTLNILSGQYTLYGNGEALSTFPEPLLNELEAHLVLNQQGRGRSALVIGGGLEFAAALLDAGVRRVDYVDIDPEALRITLPYLDFVSAGEPLLPGLEVHHADAVVFVSQAAAEGAQYDCVFIRAGEPATLLLNRLYTREFFLDVRRALSGQGVLAMPVTLAGSYLGGEVGRYAGDVYRTLAAVFDEIVVTPEAHSMFIAAAANGVLSTDIDELTRRFERRGAASCLYPQAFGLLLPPARTREINAELARLPGRVNTDWRPTTYAAHLATWAAISESPIAKVLAAANAAPRYAVFAALVVAAAAFAVPVFVRGRPRASAPLAVLFTGWAAMSMSILLIYAFQVACGYVYEWIGLLSAAFIAGTSLGGAAGTRAIPGRRMLVAAELGALAVPLVILAVLAVIKGAGPAAAAWVIPALAGAAGAATGFEFPVAAGVLAEAGMDARQRAGRLEAADHLGACAGAILAGVVVVPALGIFASLLLVAAVKALSTACAIRALGPNR